MGWHEAAMKLVIIDPGSGNLASVLRAFQKVAAEGGVAADISVTRDAAEILAADRVVLPGQGAFAVDGDPRAGTWHHAGA
jgi:glutamine amidotransferase